jgi:cell wall-active antibiotic response 4TMS protein YvqF
MNCANHSDAIAQAYCRTCGKPLCSSCAHNVRGVIYCENCLAARLEGVHPPQAVYPQGSTPGQGGATPPTPGSGPNPTVAGILAGFFPFGVGAVYTSQYAKGLAHLLIFAGLIWGTDHGGRWDAVFGIGIAFFYVYQIIDAVRSARAIQLGQPAPDPFGLGQAMGAGEKVDTRKIPMAAIILIALGGLFLLQTTGLFEMDFDRIWPLLLMFVGVWMFARSWGFIEASATRCYCDRCRMRRLMGPAVLVTVGFVFLLDAFGKVSFSRTWPAIVLVIGIVKLLQSNASGAGHVPPSLPGGPTSGAGTTSDAAAPPPANEVRNV